jgi:thiol-disulfide isomerase/thioredoxin
MKTLAALLFALVPVTATAPQEPAQKDAAPTRQVYDEKADARADVNAALARATKENRRVLVVWGANWCGWCVKLADVFKKNPELASKLQYEYDVVKVDVGQFDKHMDLAASFGADFKSTGIPVLTVLAADGKVLANQETGALELGKEHDPAKVLEFLTKHQAPYLKANELRDGALAAAKAEGKLLFLAFGAPWCGWCHRLEDFLARADVAPIVARTFRVQKIDVDRTLGGQELCDSYAGMNSGIPWFAALDANGKPLATSVDSGSNLGCPWSPEEVAAFGVFLEKAGMVAADRKLLLERLAAFKAELEAKEKAAR